MINSNTNLYISASSKPGNFGSSIYNWLFKKYNINAVYIPRKIVDVRSLIDSLKVLDVKGCSISMPLKSIVIDYINELDDIAYQTNSVNTIVNHNGKFKGYNSDYYGARKVLSNLTIRNVLIYGSGSVTNSIILALKSLKIDDIFITARNLKEAKILAKKHNITSRRNTEIEGHFELLINATPASIETVNHELFNLLRFTNKVFDLVVSPIDTPFVKIAKEKKYTVITGIDMCKFQLQKQFEFYIGFLPNISDIDEAIENNYFRNRTDK